jgi:hypothetical protein
MSGLGEVVGLAQSIAYAEHLAGEAGQHGPDGNESYLQHLAAARVTADGLASARDMQEAFAAAAAAADRHAAELGKQTSVQEAYNVNPDAGDKNFQTGDVGSDTGAPTTGSDHVRTAMNASPDTPAPGTAVAGGATPLPDAAGLGETEHWHGSDVVTAASGDGTVSLGRCQYPDSDAYVVVATNPPGTPWDPDSDSNGIDPALNQKEAGKLADALDELADLAESGAPATAPTRLEKLAARVRELIGDSGVTIAGDDGEIEVSAADMRKILDAAAPAPAAPTRRKVDANACRKDDMDTGTVWAELDTSGAEPVVAVTSTEGEPPESYPEGYTTTRLSPAEARQLAEKVRRFATVPAAGQPASAPAVSPDPVVEQVRRAYHQLADRPEGYVPLTALRDALPDVDHDQVDRALHTLLDDGGTLEPEAFNHRVGDRERQAAVHVGGEDRHYLALPSPPAAGPATAPRPAAPTPVPAPAGPQRVTNSRGRTYEYDPGTGATAVIEPDGWRAPVPPSSSTGTAAQLLWWNAEIKDGRGHDVTEDAARALLGGLNAAELREVAEAVGSSARGARTKPQLVDAIINMAIGAPRKHRALSQGWW